MEAALFSRRSSVLRRTVRLLLHALTGDNRTVRCARPSPQLTPRAAQWYHSALDAGVNNTRSRAAACVILNSQPPPPLCLSSGP